MGGEAGVDGLDDARLAYEEADRRYRASRDRLFSMFADIGAKAGIFTGGLWLVGIVPWVPKAEHAEALAEAAVSLASGAVLWILSTRLCASPWAKAAPPGVDGETKGEG